MHETDMNSLVELVEDWGDERNITGPSGGNDLIKQFEKLEEEVKELDEAIHANEYEEIVDAIGDCTVVLTLLARALQYQTGDEHSLVTCYHSAYDEIKSRTGKTVNGVFVKD